MSKRWFALIILFAMVGGGVPLSATTSAQGPKFDRTKLKGTRLQLPEGATLQGQPRSLESKPIKVTVELSDTPTALVFADRRRIGSDTDAANAAKTQRARIEAAQQQFITVARGLNAQVISRTMVVFNGVTVLINSNDVARLRQLPGVKAVYPVRIMERDHTVSVPLIGAPTLWNAAGLGVTGEGTVVSIIDTGVDYLHTDFAGPGTGYDTNDTTVNEPDEGFPSAKVVGGYDFVGDDFTGDNEPDPDADPMDCNGHGTHVAGTAAGTGVNEDGSTYTGPYGPTTPFDDMSIGPGVAPEAKVLAVRVFGCEGSTTTDIMTQAIEFSVDPNGDGDPSDHVDVINMSIGSIYDPGTSTDIIAYNNAAEVGVIPVGSAGNDGDAYYVTAGPGVAERALGVAASVDALDILDGMRIESPPEIAGVYYASQSVAYDWDNDPGVTAQVAYPASQPTGCQPFNNANKALLAGKIALLDWTTPSCGGSVARTDNAAAAGAVGAILVDDSEIFDLFITGSEVIPAVSTPKEVGDTIKAQLAEGDIVTATLTNEYREELRYVIPERTDTIASFSSRGPRRGGLLKPDLAAPGVSIFSAQTGSGSFGDSLQGTSMAAPHVAGSMALLRQLHPDWSVEELKALAMNTANTRVRSDLPSNSPIYGSGRVGAGRITLAPAAQSEVVAYNADEEGVVSISFGALEVLERMTMTKGLTISNKGDTPATYNVRYVSTNNIPGVGVSLTGTGMSGGKGTITVPAGGTVTLQVLMSADPAIMRRNLDPTINVFPADLPRHWLSEEGGMVQLLPTRSGAGPTLEVPVYLSARPTSDMHAANDALRFRPRPGSTNDPRRAQIELTGTPVATGTTPDYPIDVLSLVTALELQAGSDNEPNIPGNRGLEDAADIQYLGVTTDYSATRSLGDSRVFFGIATHGEWQTPSYFITEFDIYINTDDDADDEFVLYNADYGSVTGGDPLDVYVTVLINLETGDLFLQDFVNAIPASQYDTALLDNSVMVMPVYAADLGLTEANATISYGVVSFAYDVEGAVDVVGFDDDDRGALRFNVVRPGMNFTSDIPGVPTYADVPGEKFWVRFDQVAYEASSSEGVLLLHHHNGEDRRAEVVEVLTENTETHVYLPLVLK